MNTLTSISEFGQAWWAEVRKKVRNAAVFLDSTACECLHWNGGAPFLLEAGAQCIKEFSAFEVFINLKSIFNPKVYSVIFSTYIDG